jgi:Zn ribbon nucleic-acid-binding protein
MAHRIWINNFDKKCPQCKDEKIRLASYHFGATITAECANCGFGSKGSGSREIYGCDEDQATARLRGLYISKEET